MMMLQRIKVRRTTISNGNKKIHLFDKFQLNSIFRAIQLSRESAEQMIDESDIAERKYFGEPVGLKNVGNTCWFNSIIQTLYALTDFRRLILDFRFVSSSRPLTEKVISNQTFSFSLQENFVKFVFVFRNSS